MWNLLALLALSPLLAAQDAGPAADLARAVDLPDAKARRSAALELAQRKDVTLAQWLELCAGFGAFPPLAPGVHHETVPLRVLGKDEATPISFYVPKSYDPGRPAPLLLAMHGTGMNGRQEYLMWQEVAETLGMLILAPSETGANEGYAFTERERQVALQALRWLRRRCNVDENRIFCSGESRGGHMTWDLALRRPDHFAALAPMIGGPSINPAKGLNNVRYMASIAHLPIRDLQGAKDDPGLVANVRAGFARLAELGAADAKLLEFEDLGHGFRFAAVDWVALLGKARRSAVPERVVLAFARPGEARSHWVEVTRYAKPVEENFTPRLTAKELEALQQKDDAGRKRWWQEQCDQRTGRIVATRQGRGVFHVEGTGVASFRLLLDAGMFEPRKPIELHWQGKTLRPVPSPTPRVLLTEFVERFDRTFLPIATVEVP